ncbi:phosphoribosylanthranilate isomerase [bacterium]|nr:phosphoribosylanthranilate isomerase [bacterium]
MSLHIKICCIASQEEMLLAHAAGANAVGLVSAMPSGPGVIDETTIARVAAAAPTELDRFLLTSLTDPREIVAQHARCRTRTIQLCRSVEPLAFPILRAALGDVQLVQVIHVEGEENLEEARRYSVLADALLLDSGRPNAKVPELGGTGRTHDWSLAARIVQEVPCPVWLAGGLGPHNAAQAIAQVRPHGLDICSGVRTNGQLDAKKLQAFVAAARGGVRAG